ncbi:MAG: chemotaxis protein CheW [Verrucomicrobiales bacterium]|nr:chemotaxis protein CheW [Verrucomicrobiales bacterium]
MHDCWRTIGVQGTATCVELQKFVHCRNCPVYSAAALQLLDRPLWPEYLREQTLHYAEPRRKTTPARLSVLVFRLGWEWLALPTVAFQEIVEVRFIHSLPHRRNGIVLGLVNVRGELIVCVSLGRLLGLETAAGAPAKSFQAGAPPPSHPAVRDVRPVPSFAGKPAAPSASTPASPANGPIPRLAVTHWENGRLAFPVDEVAGVVRLPREEIHEPPATVGVSGSTFTSGIFQWQGRTVGFLDAGELFAALNRHLS